MSTDDTCRLCHSPLRSDETRRRLCSVCDEYAQHVALQSNKGLDKIVSEVQKGGAFVMASRRMH